MASDTADAGNAKYFILALGLLVGFVIGFVMLLSRLPVDSTLSDYTPSQVLGSEVARAETNYEFYTVLEDQVDGNVAVVTDVTQQQQKVIQPATRIVPGSVQNTQRRNLAAETYAEIPASSIGQESYYLQAGSYPGSGDAERMRAALLMLGFEAFIVKRQDASGQTGHRVRIGPFFDQGRLTEAKKRLRRGNVAYDIIRVTG